MQHVFVLDTDKRPRDPVHPGDARRLLSLGQAAVFRRYPFTIILNSPSEQDTEPLRLKIDPGSRTTGLALTNGDKVVFAAELSHRGHIVKAALDSRRALRRSRRSRKTRYRKARFDNRRRDEDWLPPSLQSRVANVGTWVRRLARYAPVKFLSLELVKFDTQLMENPEISGVEYQQGTLSGYELRQYLLEKWGRKCAYCKREDVPLQIEHIQPLSRGGTNRASNLTVACEACNIRKGNQAVEQFLAKKADVLKQIKAQAKSPLRDVAAVNTTRWALYKALKLSGLEIECGTGGRTKFNRVNQCYPKAHWIDAACVGVSGARVDLRSDMVPLQIKAGGHGRRQMCSTDAFGFPKQHRTAKKLHYGFKTGDIVKAIVPKGKGVGTHVGRVTCRASGSFNIKAYGKLFRASHKYCQLVHRMDGYSYEWGVDHNGR